MKRCSKLFLVFVFLNFVFSCTSDDQPPVSDDLSSETLESEEAASEAIAADENQPPQPVELAEDQPEDDAAPESSAAPEKETTLEDVTLTQAPTIEEPQSTPVAETPNADTTETPAVTENETEQEIAQPQTAMSKVETTSTQEEELQQTQAAETVEPTTESHDTTVATEEIASESNTYIVHPGDTLSKIAKKLYGDAGAAAKLIALNNISNPNLIYPGDVIRFEETKGTNAKNIKLSTQTITIKNGDTLYRIASRLLGNPAAWKFLWRFNENQIRDPNKLTIGEKITFNVPVVNGFQKSH